MKKTGELFIISAPSGAGKTSLVQGLVAILPNLNVSISHTTRPKRLGEKEGVNYYFVTQTQFKEMLSQGAFLEHAQVFGNYYGTSRTFVEEALTNGKDVILEIDWQGARQIRKHYANIMSIFILPPSREELLSRLTKRHPDNPALVEERMKESKQEISHYNEYDYLVCNDKFESALADLKAIVSADRLREFRQEANLEPLIKSLLA